mgnify:CR=1 FL=1
MRDIKVFTEKHPYNKAVGIYFYERQPDGKIAVVTNLEFTIIDPSIEMERGSGIDLSYETTQDLMDRLWECGLRPSEGSGSAGSLKATENHLKDMQSLSWKLLDMLKGKSNES